MIAEKAAPKFETTAERRVEDPADPHVVAAGLGHHDASSAIMIRIGTLRTSEISVAVTRSAAGEGGEGEEHAPGERGADRRREHRVEDRRVERGGFAHQAGAAADEQLTVPAAAPSVIAPPA